VANCCQISSRLGPNKSRRMLIGLSQL
jgi:hypothetical protein